MFTPPPSRGRLGGGWVSVALGRALLDRQSLCFTAAFRLKAGVLSSCFAQKKVAKEDGDPTCAVGCANAVALLARPGGCGTRGYAPQTVLADFPRPVCVAHRSRWGPRKGVSVLPLCLSWLLPHFYGQPQNRPNFGHSRESGNPPAVAHPWIPAFAGRTVTLRRLWGPSAGAEQRRSWRKKGEDCLRAEGPSSAAPANFEQRREPGAARH